MKAFVLAAGFGSRLRPFIEHLPKPLMPVLNVPALFYTFSLLKEAGVTEIFCNIHHHAAKIRKAVETQDFRGTTIRFSEEQPILGTGGGLKKCECLLDDDEFFLVNSDIITDIDLRDLRRHHRSSGAAGTLVLYETPDAPAIGQVGVENGLVRDFRNMRGTGLASMSIYTGTALLSPVIFRYLERGFSSIIDTGFTGLIDNEGLAAYRHRGTWIDIGTIATYHRVNTQKDALPATITETVGRATGVLPHTLSPQASIDPSARVRRSSVGAGCKIGAGAIVEDSVLLPGAVVAARETLRLSIRDRHTSVVLEEHP